MKTKHIYITFLIVIISFISKAQDAPVISGYVRNYTGMLTSENNEFSIVQNTLNINIEKNSDGWLSKQIPIYTTILTGIWNWDYARRIWTSISIISI